MLPTDNFYLLAVIVYGGLYMLGVAVVGSIMQLYGVVFLSLFALALCYLQTSAAVIGMKQGIQVLCFWVAFVCAVAAGVILAYNLIIRF